MAKNKSPDVWERVVGLIVNFFDRRAIRDHEKRIKTLGIITRAKARAGSYEAVKEHFAKPKDEQCSYEAVREIIKGSLFPKNIRFAMPNPSDALMFVLLVIGVLQGIGWLLW